MTSRALLILLFTACWLVCTGGSEAEATVPVDLNRVALLSDTHIGDPADGDERKPMPVRNLKEAISKIVTMRPRPAAVLVAGDCAFLHGKKSDYAMLRRIFAPLREADIPFHFAMGNHDNRKAFYAVFPEMKPKTPLVEGKHVTVVSTPKADWILLDSNKETDYTPGRFGKNQLAWLRTKLERQKGKPTILLAHHNPNPKKGGSGLEDTEPFFAIADAHPAAKAYIFGHSHVWISSKRNSGLHLINLPTTAWTFDDTVRRGFIDAKVDDTGMTITFHAVEKGNALDGNEYRFDWRDGKSVMMTMLSRATPTAAGRQQWHQLKYDARHSGNASDRQVATPLGLVGAVPLSDAIFTSPVVGQEHLYAVDGSGEVFCIDIESLAVVWHKKTAGGAANCNNVSSPAIIGPYLHFGTTAGYYYVLDRKTGRMVRQIDCGDPIFSAPVVVGNRVYFATLGSQVYAVQANGDVAWTWDFVKKVIGFDGDRWSGEQWYRFRTGRVNWRDHFCCSRNLAAFGKTIVVPSGGRTLFIEDTGPSPRVRAVAEIPEYVGKEYAAAFGQSIGEDGAVYIQWHRRDNAGRVEVLKINGNDLVTSSFVPGTETAINLHGLLSFASVSVRGEDVYRTRPEEGCGLIRHKADRDDAAPLPVFPSICAPILLRNQVVHGGLDGKLYVAALPGKAARSKEPEPWSFATAFGRPITAPAAVCDGRIYFGCEDGYLYVLGPGGKAPLPTRDLGLCKIRTPLRGNYADAKFDWYTNYGDMGCTNANDQGIEPPVKIKWIRRVEGTVKHLPVCGGGRMYTHTAEGQIMAVEQETGRLLWRRYWPGVYLSFTSPLYYREKLLVPQAGLTRSRMRCLDAATGRLLWERPFTGSPSWSRQFPPVVHENLAIYASGSGRYAAQGSERAYIFRGKPNKRPDGAEVMSFQYTHDNPYYPHDNLPYLWAWDLDTGELAWKKDFAKYGSGGNDCGIAMMDGKLYYSTFFGYEAERRRRRGVPPGINGLTACIDPSSGEPQWLTTDFYVTAGCTLTAKDGRLYLGGYNPARGGTDDRYLFCLDAGDGSLVWRSDPVKSAVNVVTVGKDFVFSNAIRAECHIFDKETGKITYDFDLDYACCRFTLSGSYLLGANMDLLDLSNGHKLVATGPAIDSRECLGSSVSNGRMFYTSQASGLQASAVTGTAAKQLRAPWERE